MPNLLKIGFTMKDPAIRANELAQTGVPHPYQVEYEVLVNNPEVFEKESHKKLSNFREGKEWFRCSVEDAAKTISSLTKDKRILETCYFEETKKWKEKLEQEARQKVKQDFLNSPSEIAKREQQKVEREYRLAQQRTQPSSVTYTGNCKHCNSEFTENLGNYNVGAICPACNRFNDLSAFIRESFPVF